jgi:CRISPR/Cas system-associated protein Csm6
MMTHHDLPPIDLMPGTVHRVVVDLVRIGLWSEQQAAITSSEVRRRQLGMTTLACRLAAEVVRESLCVPHAVQAAEPIDTAYEAGWVRALHQNPP